VRLRNRLVVLIVADTRDKIILVDAAAHCTVHHETEAAEHPFFDRIMAHQTFAYPFCQLLVECHNLSFLRPQPSVSHITGAGADLTRAALASTAISHRPTSICA
jgi:hypothetical protein